jgi:hypothetical protein
MEFLPLQPLLLDFFLDDLDREILDKFPNEPFARFYDKLFIPLKCGVTSDHLHKIKNHALNAGTPLSILRPGDGKRVSIHTGSLLINQYGRVQINRNGRSQSNF